MAVQGLLYHEDSTACFEFTPVLYFVYFTEAGKGYFHEPQMLDLGDFFLLS